MLTCMKIYRWSFCARKADATIIEVSMDGKEIAGNVALNDAVADKGDWSDYRV